MYHNGAYCTKPTKSSAHVTRDIAEGTGQLFKVECDPWRRRNLFEVFSRIHLVFVAKAYCYHLDYDQAAKVATLTCSQLGKSVWIELRCNFSSNPLHFLHLWMRCPTSVVVSQNCSACVHWKIFLLLCIKLSFQHPDAQSVNFCNEAAYCYLRGVEERKN